MTKKASQPSAAAIAPSGVLRAAINLGNPVLAQRNQLGEFAGVSVALARELGKRLDVEVTLQPYNVAMDVFNAGPRGEWDVAFLAIDPKRASALYFTEPYVLLEGRFVVRNSSAFKTWDDVDRPGVKIAVGEGSAYDLYLTRNIKNASIERHNGGNNAKLAFERLALDVVADIQPTMAAFADSSPNYRMLAEPFMSIAQAIALPKDRGDGLAYVESFIEEMKRSGFVARELNATGFGDVTVAPAKSQS